MFYLGVDGGGTKTAFTLMSGTGHILGHAVLGTSHPDQIGLDAVRGLLQQGVEQVCSIAGIEIKDLTYSFLGLPGFGENLAYIPQLENMIAALLDTDRFLCGNDVLAGWAGSLACRPGIHLVAGTGAIGFGRDPQGNTARSSGWSEVFGDEGSAYWLGRNVLGLFSKQSDYRLPKTPIYHLAKETLEVERDLDVIPRVGSGKRDEIAALALVAFKAAQQGDELALDLYKQAAYEHSLTVKAIIEQLEFPANAPIAVSYSGGVFAAGELILTPLRDFLQDKDVSLRKPLLSPSGGSCLYAYVLSGGELSQTLIDNLQEAEGQLKL